MFCVHPVTKSRSSFNSVESIANVAITDHDQLTFRIFQPPEISTLLHTGRIRLQFRDDCRRWIHLSCQYDSESGKQIQGNFAFDSEVQAFPSSPNSAWSVGAHYRADTLTADRNALVPASINKQRLVHTAFNLSIPQRLSIETGVHKLYLFHWLRWPQYTASDHWGERSNLPSGFVGTLSWAGRVCTC